jgi:O-antigen/teichoic acid export membrane protein
MLSQKLKQLSTNQFICNLGWLGSAELIQRIARLGTTVTLARVFPPETYGMVSAIYTVFSFALVFGMTESLIANIVQTDDDRLEAVCDTVFWLMSLIVAALIGLQCLLSYPIASFYGTNQLVLPICVLSATYLYFPFFLIQLALLTRGNQLKIRASCQAGQSIISNLMIIVLAILGFKVWSVVLGMLISFPIWIFITNKYSPWRPSFSRFTLEGSGGILRFAVSLSGVELLSLFRLNVDYLLITRFLGLEALGIYFFAFNAGLGISQGLISSLSTAWYPHFCEVRSNLTALRSRFLSSFRSIFTFLLLVVFLQTTLAPIYIPIIFGAKWIPAVPILILICLSAIPFAMGNANSQLLRALGQTKLDLSWNSIFTVGFALILLLVVKQGIFWVAAAVLAVQMFAVPNFSWFIYRKFFPNKLLVDQ